MTGGVEAVAGPIHPGAVRFRDDLAALVRGGPG